MTKKRIPATYSQHWQNDLNTLTCLGLTLFAMTVITNRYLLTGNKSKLINLRIK